MVKLYFSINKNEKGELCDLIFYSKTKTTAKNELRDKGITPKLVLTWQDIENIKINQLQNNDMTEKLEEYVLSHVEEWQKTKDKLENLERRSNSNEN